MKYAVQLARDVLAMEDRIFQLEQEVTRLMWFEEAYHKLLNEGVQHGEKMMAGWLTLLTDPKSPVVRGLAEQPK